MGPNRWEKTVTGELTRLRDARLYRRRRLVRPIDATHVEVDGRYLVNFSSNNYLGLTHHPRLVEAVRGAVARDGAGSGAAPLITGYTPAHLSAERAIATWKQTEAAVLLPSGYQANLAAVQTLATAGESTDGGVRFLLDKLCHASLIDAVRGVARAGRREGFRVFPHNDMAKLGRLLREAEPNQTQVVVTESVFSMDGDTADLAGLAELKRDHPYLLLLDEAHGSGVYGPDGSGLAAERGFSRLPDVTVVTFSKALGCVGAAVCASEALCELLINAARPFIYSTAPPSSVAAAAEAAIAIMRNEPARQQRLRRMALHVRAQLTGAGLTLPDGDSPILPVLLGDERSAIQAAARLLEDGLLVLPIRPPTVPRGSSRLRITLSCEHSDEELQRLAHSLTNLG
jgi:8-amino-7-oxononanoate synthase